MGRLFCALSSLRSPGIQQIILLLPLIGHGRERGCYKFTTRMKHAHKMHDARMRCYRDLERSRARGIYHGVASFRCE